MSQFSDDAIRAVVAKARYSEPGAAEHIVTTLIKRRDKVLRAWLTGVNPLVNARLTSDGVLTFENAAVDAVVSTPPAEYRFTVSRFDNATGVATQQAEGTARGPRLEITAPALRDDRVIQVSVRTIHPDHPMWANPVTFTFRRAGTEWQTIGLDRTGKFVVKK